MFSSNWMSKLLSADMGNIIELKLRDNRKFKTRCHAEASHDMEIWANWPNATNAKIADSSECIHNSGKAVKCYVAYAKAFYRHAKGYYVRPRYKNYATMQDIKQACILENFKNKAFIEMAIGTHYLPKQIITNNNFRIFIRSLNDDICVFLFIYCTASTRVNHAERAYYDLNCGKREGVHSNKQMYQRTQTQIRCMVSVLAFRRYGRYQLLPCIYSANSYSREHFDQIGSKTCRSKNGQSHHDSLPKHLKYRWNCACLFLVFDIKNWNSRRTKWEIWIIIILT